MRPTNRRPTAPGALLKELYLEPRNITIGRFAQATGLTRKHISKIVNGHSALSPETAVKFGLVLDTSTDLWINAQRGVDIWDAQKKLKRWKPTAVYAGDVTTGDA